MKYTINKALFATTIVAVGLMGANAHAAGGSFGNQAAAIAAGNTTAGTASGSTTNPWIVEDCIDLQAIGSGSVRTVGSNGVNPEDDNYQLAGDIDCTDTGNTSSVWSGSGFYPIGFDNNFAGNLNGSGYVVNNITINRMGDTFAYVGPIGQTSGAAVIENIGMTNISITTDASTTGGIVSDLAGTLSNSHSSGIINAVDYVGGLAGENSGTIENSYSSANIEAGEYIGGLVGFNDSTIDESFSTGTLTGSLYVGGIAGDNSNTISNSYSAGSITADGSAGGVAGENYDTITNSYSVSTVSGSVGSSDIGGLVGYDDGVAITNSYYSTDVNSSCYHDASACGDAANGRTSAQLRDESFLSGNTWDFGATWLSAAGVNGGFPVHLWHNYTELFLAGAAVNAETSTADAGQKTRAADAIAYIQSIKGEDFDAALPTDNLTSNKALNGLKMATRFVGDDADSLTALSNLAVVFLDLGQTPTTKKEVQDEIRDWRLAN